MRIVILAAGVGSRLYPLTMDSPKAMIKINEKPLIQYQVESMIKLGFAYEDIYIIGGYMIERIEEHFTGTGIHFIYNPFYKSINNIYSFLLSQAVDDDILLINSDGFYDNRLITLILNSKFPTCILVDHEKGFTEEAMKVKLEGNRLHMINKQLHLTDTDGEYIGISKLAVDDLKVLYKKATDLIEAGETNSWYENVYEACAANVEIQAVNTKGYPWIEIDDLHDLEYAKQLASAMDTS
ncbi:CTP:phosphoglutamine cytidylyltransferase [Bacillus rhizoplanae]|uniref:CTP:phosphoglutamine cytidylyltransferase n=1 Tax=Bacillus rhizoplanae TaxID=2880966 RepID=A0ABN8A0N1_9BACI|nr:phosphocholine cytidylyltransferase family protein [Bacillus rhizoplanae]CAG9613120.1 CTP:phosphoglutamine cytidylyltransferase [Bacillus rhizoplanae]